MIERDTRFHVYIKPAVPGAEWHEGIATDDAEDALEFVTENLPYFRMEFLDLESKINFTILRPDELENPERLARI